MVQISAVQVKQLRDRTGAGMMDCKKVLVEAEGDADRALKLLRERGLAKARGKAGRATQDGAIVASLSEDRRRAALIEVNCETDFVARTEKFANLARELADQVRDQAPAGVDALLALTAEGGSVNDQLVEAIANLGENIQVRRIERLEAAQGGRIESYIHAGGKIGTLVQIEAEDVSSAEIEKLMRNVCMHVAATNPSGISREDIPATEVEMERSVLRKQAEAEGKPAQIVEKMVEGRLNKFFKEVVLLEQPLVMDPDLTVAKAIQPRGARITAIRRFQLGEELAG